MLLLWKIFATGVTYIFFSVEKMFLRHTALTAISLCEAGQSLSQISQKQFLSNDKHPYTYIYTAYAEVSLFKSIE